MLGVRLTLTGAWIVSRLLLAPLLYLPYRAGLSMRWAYELDAFIKRTCFPLTERSDSTRVLQVEPSIRPGDAIPDVEVTRDGRKIRLVEHAEGHPLLLIVFRGSWCPYSRLHVTELAAAQRRFEAAGIRMLGVSTRGCASWWRSKGVAIPMADDPDATVFAALGVRARTSFPNRVWGTILPHESVFLFARGGALLAADVRRLSSLKLRQTFLSADRLLELAPQVRVD